MLTWKITGCYSLTSLNGIASSRFNSSYPLCSKRDEYIRTRIHLHISPCEFRTFLRVPTNLSIGIRVGTHNRFESYQVVKASLCLLESNTKSFAENLQLGKLMRLQNTHSFSKTVFKHGVGKTMSQKLTFSHPFNIQESQ